MSGADTSYVKAPVASSLPTAAGADEAPVSTGAGTTYVATPLTAAVGDTLADLYGALDAGDFYVSDGAGVVPASTVPATVRGVIGVTGAWTILTAADLSLRNGTRGTVALASGRLDFTVDGVAGAFYDGTARTAARAYVAIPATVSDVVLSFRLYTRTSGSAQTYTSVAGLLRSGSDDTAAPSVASAYYGSGLTMVSLPGTAHYNDGTRFYAGEFAGSGAYGTGGTGGVAWPANDVVNTSWLGVRWKDGRIGYGVVVAPADVPPDPEDYLWSWPAHASQWAGPPSLAVLALEQTGATPSAQAVTAEARVYYR